MRLRGGVCSAAILTLGLAACGGGGSNSGSGSSPSAYLAAVNKICAANNAKVTALPASTANTAAGLDKLVAIATSSLNQVKAVKPPGSLSAGADSWLGVIQQEAVIANQLVSAFKAGDKTKALALAAQATSLGSRGDSQAKALGLASCAASAQPSGH